METQCLNSLKQKGILDWKSGGLMNKRGKHGQPLANDYRLNLSTSCKKGKIKGADSVAHADTNRKYNSHTIIPNNTDTEHRRIGAGFARHKLGYSAGWRQKTIRLTRRKTDVSRKRADVSL